MNFVQKITSRTDLVTNRFVIFARYLYGLDFGQVRAQNYFFDFWAWEGILIPPSCVRSQSHGGKLDFLAKIATKNRQNRQLAEFRETYYTKLVEHQILIEKMVS